MDGTPEHNQPCSGIAGAVQDFTGGASNQSFVDDVVNNFVDTTDFGVSDVANSLGVGFDLPSVLNPGVDSATSLALGGLVARTYGGVTPFQALGQAWNASRSAIRTPGLIGFRTVPSLIATSGATWAVNAVLIKGVYNSGVLVGSISRTAVNRAATATCGQ